MWKIVASLGLVAMLLVQPAIACDDDDDDGCRSRRARPAKPTGGMQKVIRKSETSPSQSPKTARSTPSGGVIADSLPPQCKRYFASVGEVISVPCSD